MAWKFYKKKSRTFQEAWETRKYDKYKPWQVPQGTNTGCSFNKFYTLKSTQQ